MTDYTNSTQGHDARTMSLQRTKPTKNKFGQIQSWVITKATRKSPSLLPPAKQNSLFAAFFLVREQLILGMCWYTLAILFGLLTFHSISILVWDRERLRVILEFMHIYAHSLWEKRASFLSLSLTVYQWSKQHIEEDWWKINAIQKEAKCDCTIIVRFRFVQEFNQCCKMWSAILDCTWQIMLIIAPLKFPL